MAIFKACFDEFDADGGGSIDTAELEKLLNAFGVYPDEEEMRNMVLEVDEDGSGEIEFDEFLQMLLLRMERNMMLNKDALKHAFDTIDEDHDGEVDSDQMEEFLMKRADEGMTTKEAQAMIKVADADGSGTVNFEEFWGFATTAMDAANEKKKNLAQAAQDRRK